HPHSRWSFCAQGHRMLSPYQASYPAILDIATYLSLTKLLGGRVAVAACKQYDVRLQTGTVSNSRSLRIGAPANPRSLQTNPPSIANSLQTDIRAHDHCEQAMVDNAGQPEPMMSRPISLEPPLRVRNGLPPARTAFLQKKGSLF